MVTGDVTTLTQDYAALPGSADAAAQHARTVVAEYQPHEPQRADDAATIVKSLFLDALTRTSLGGNISLITTIDSERIRFEMHDPDEDIPGAEPPIGVHRRVSALADAYGAARTRTGHMTYAEIHLPVHVQ